MKKKDAKKSSQLDAMKNMLMGHVHAIKNVMMNHEKEDSEESCDPSEESPEDKPMKRKFNSR